MHAAAAQITDACPIQPLPASNSAADKRRQALLRRLWNAHNIDGSAR